MKDDLGNLGIKETISSIKKGEFSAKEITKYYLDKIDGENKNLNIYLEIFEDALPQAEEVDKKIKKGEDLGLAGVPVAVKDNILIKGRISSAGSKILENYRAPYNATAAEKLSKSGAIFLGRTNMDEFAMGSSTENSAYGATKNPIDVERVPGGSSGGSAAAIAANLAVGALGSETGGSVRQPASFCGVVGLKPTYGSVSRYGLIAMASSLDQIAPLARNVEDCEVLFKNIKGHDTKDSTSVKNINKPGKKTKRLCYPEKFLESGVDKDVLLSFNKYLEELRKTGYTIDPIDISYLDHSLAIYYIIMPAEASSNLARFDGIKYGLSVEGEDPIDRYFKTRGLGFGTEVRRRIMLGTYVLSSGYYDAYYKKATDVRNLMRLEFNKVFKNYDAVITPTSPTPAFKVGERASDPLKMYLADILTVSANLIGSPAISIPKGEVERDNTKLPLGIQLMAPHFGEETIFEIGKDIEKIN